MVSLSHKGIFLFYFTFLNNFSVVSNQQVSDHNWCPSSYSNIDIPLNNYTILDWGKYETYGQRIKECRWRVYLQQARRIRFDIMGLRLYSVQCYQSYNSGISECSDSITVYYGDCTADKVIIKYQGNNNKPGSFVGYTDTLCFHFIPNIQPSLSGAFYAKMFYFKIGVSVLEKTCIYKETEGNLCQGICHANGTKTPYQCQGNNNKERPLSPQPHQLSTPSKMFSVTPVLLSSQVTASSSDIHSDTYPLYHTTKHITVLISEHKSHSLSFLTTDFRSIIFSRPVSYDSSDFYSSVNFNNTMATFQENELMITTNSTNYESNMDSVSMTTSNSLLSESYRLLTDKISSAIIATTPVSTVRQWSKTMSIDATISSSSGYNSDSISTTGIIHNFNTSSITTHPLLLVSFGESTRISTAVNQESSRDVSHNPSAIRPTPTVKQEISTHSFISIMSEALTTESVSRNDNAVRKQESNNAQNIDENIVIMVTTVVGVVFVIGIILTLSCIIRRQRRGEGSFASDTDTVYHNTDDAPWRQNWTVKKTFNDVWMSTPGEKPSLPPRDENTSTKRHSKLSRKRTLSCSDESTDHECGLYDVTRMTTRDYISCMNDIQQKKDQTNYVRPDKDTVDRDQMYTRIKR